MRFAVFCKTFRDDREHFLHLLESFERHNVDRLPLFVSVPRADRALFGDLLAGHKLEFFIDEDVLGRAPHRQGWIAQQLVKLEAHRLDFADAWLWVDSDAYFLRDFRLADFVRADGSVAMVAGRRSHAFEAEWEFILTFLRDPAAARPFTREELCSFEEGRRLRIPRYQAFLDALLDVGYEPRAARPRTFFGRTGPECHPLRGVVWTRESLTSFVDDVLAPARLSFERLLAHSPWEAAWIAEWELFRGLPGRHVIEPTFAHARLDETIERMRAAGISEAMLASRYLGVNLAARHAKLTRLDADP